MKTFLSIDYWMQTIFLGLIFLTIPFVFVPLFLLFAFGVWQLLSGTLTAIFYKKLDRKAYLLKALGYLVFLYLGYVAVDLFPFLDGLTGIGFFILWLMIPVGIGIWYYLMVKTDYHCFCTKEAVKHNTMEMNSPFI